MHVLGNPAIELFLTNLLHYKLLKWSVLIGEGP